MGENEMWSGNSMERHDGGRAVPEQLRRGFRWFDSTENLPLALWPPGLWAGERRGPPKGARGLLRGHKRGREWVVPNRSGLPS
jgi:hypothetical protein